MGLFSRGENIEIPRDVLNISPIYKSLWLETADGFITMGTFIPSEMKKVTALIIGKERSHTGDIRIPVSEIVEFDCKPFALSDSSSPIRDFGFNGEMQLTIVTNNKKYHFDIVGNNCSKDEIKMIVNDSNLSDEEMLEKVHSTSCLSYLSSLLTK